jgi:hypothetical protein
MTPGQNAGEIMKDCFGQHGWKEFHRNRKNILDEYQKLLELTENRPVQVAHGQGVEAYIRKWLSEFLPKKYGVTSGYIIPNLYSDSGAIYHFDIIIYNRLEAPILWTEGNEDNSEQGKYRAIPAKYVVSVYEVKSRLTKTNVVDALAKLGQIDGFKAQLPSNYSSGIIFIELKESENRSEAIVKALHQGKNIHGFTGGLILRYENDDSATGNIVLRHIDKEQSDGERHLSPLAKKIDDLNIFQKEDGNVTLAEKGGGAILVATSKDTWAVSKIYSVGYSHDGISVDLSWSRSNFSRFCVDLLSRLEGLAFNDKRRPSFGMVFDSLRQEKAPSQPAEPHPNYPFLSVRLHGGGPNGESHLLDFAGDDVSITFWVEVANEGFAEATLSDDRFQTSIALSAGKRAIKPVAVQACPKEGGPSVEELLDGKGLEIPYRLVYKAGPEGKELISLEKMILVKTANISISGPPTQGVGG